MFENIGGKIKGVCKLCCCLGIGCCLLLGLVLLLNGTSASVVTGAVIAAPGSLLCWLSSLTLYGFGQLVENSGILAGRMQGGGPESQRTAQKPDGQPSGGKRKAKVTGPVPSGALIFPTRTESEIKCPKCGFAQIGYRDICRSCKAPFFYKDEME